MLWICKQVHPTTGLAWASPRDATGTYGLTKVECSAVTFGGPGLGTLSMVRNFLRVIKILEL